MTTLSEALKRWRKGQAVTTTTPATPLDPDKPSVNDGKTTITKWPTNIGYEKNAGLPCPKPAKGEVCTVCGWTLSCRDASYRHWTFNSGTVTPLKQIESKKPLELVAKVTSLELVL